MSRYQYLAADTLTGVIKAELPLDGVTWGKTINRAGAFAATIPIGHVKATKENLATARTSLYVLRDNVLVWGGILWTARGSTNGQAVTLGAEETWSYWAGSSGNQSRSQILTGPQDFTGGSLNPVDAALNLIAADQYEVAAFGGIPLAVRTPDTALFPAAVNPGALYPQGTSIGQAIQTLSALAPSFDFEIVPSWNGNSIVQTITFYFQQGVERSELRLEGGVNLSQVDQEEDGTGTANQVWWQGANADGTPLFGYAANNALLGANWIVPPGPYPLLSYLGQDSTNTLQWQLSAEAQVYLAANQLPYVSLPTLNVVTTPNVQPGTIGIGDQLWVTADAGWIQANGWHRVMGYTVTVDSEGAETMALQMDEVTD